MATILLQAAGAYFGGFFGAAFGAVGSALGAAAGYALDRALLTSTRSVEGPRLDAQRPFTAEDGAPLPRVYGTVRVSGTLIWATRFEEEVRAERQGAKGGPKVTTFSYFANVAFALCEGEIAGIRRIWADGRELDLEQVELRLYSGSETQEADPLIAAKQAPDEAPAYRGTAYVVFERLPLDAYGNRIPQFQFEVMRPVGGPAGQIRAIAMIPGSTEFGLSARAVTRRTDPGKTEYLNRHVLAGATDFVASLDELQALCPGLRHVALVVTWFGNDLRAGICRIRPGVTETDVPGLSATWSVSGVLREEAYLVSRHEGNAAYGGSPSDISVMEAIAEMKARGLSVTLYPFVMMDVPAGNGLADPHGGTEQAAYPWRGRITSMPGPAQPGSADRTAAAGEQVAAFCGTAAIGDFQSSAEGVGFSGAADDFGYRRLILHYAHLAAAAGGVDAFLIGSELRGLTTLRNDEGAFPFVDQLMLLAAEVKSVLGEATKITYGADWSEYFGHHPHDGSGDVLFHLDALWASPHIDAVGIDNYMPLSDWRDQDHAGGNPDGFRSPCDPGALRTSIVSGEGFDWYYADDDARRMRSRSPITDGAHAKPWVFRYKDLVSWWTNPHHDRVGGVEKPGPTAWMPRSKPIWMTELGCPAVDKGPNQPNVFPDPKSAESALPHFSHGGRSDLAQAAFLLAHHAHWSEGAEDFSEANNPVSTVYPGRMVDAERLYVWAWDARPFPVFPVGTETWADGSNWLVGHWLNGRLSGASAGGIIEAVFAERGLPRPVTELADGFCHGYVQSGPATARQLLEPLLEGFGIAAAEHDDALVFANFDAAGTPSTLDEIVSPPEGPVLEFVAEPAGSTPGELMIAFRDPLRDHQSASATARTVGAASRREALEFPGTLETGVARAMAQNWLRHRVAGRETVRLAAPPGRRDLVPGGLVTLAAGQQRYRVEEIEDGIVRQLTLRRAATPLPAPARVSLEKSAMATPALAGAPHVLFVDLPMGVDASPPEDRFKIAARADPWRTQAVFASVSEQGFAQRGTVLAPAITGMLIEDLRPGVEGRIDRAATLTLRLLDGSLQSVPFEDVLNGANPMAVRSAAGAWEVLQFAEAEEVAASIWRLTTMLRGQGGTGDAAAAGAAAGSDVVLLDRRVVSAGLKGSEIGTEMNWRVMPAGLAIDPALTAKASVVGGMRALAPLSPVHLKVSDEPGGVSLTWTRRGRIDADSWLGPDIPLGEEAETYQIEVSHAGSILRTAETPVSNWLYPAAAITTDLPQLPAEVSVAVRQVSRRVGPGFPASLDFIVPAI